MYLVPDRHDEATPTMVGHISTLVRLDRGTALDEAGQLATEAYPTFVRESTKIRRSYQLGGD